MASVCHSAGVGDAWQNHIDLQILNYLLPGPFWTSLGRLFAQLLMKKWVGPDWQSAVLLSITGNLCQVFLVNPCPEQFVDTSYSKHRGSPFLNLSPRSHARKFLLSTTFSDFWDCSLSWTSYTRNWWSRLLHHKYVAPTTVFAEYHLKQFYRAVSQCCSLKVICEASTISLLIAVVR